MIADIGQQLGNYRLLRLLGQGSSADVYLGKHIYLETLAAVKVLRLCLAASDQQVFLQEARIIAHLIHPAIMRVLEFGVQDNTPFLIMNYAPHGSIRQYHPQGTPLPLPLVVSYVKQLAGALQYAHEHKLIHRNIKPENLLLGREREVLLSDFGVTAVPQSSHSQSMKEIVGTVAYMAPEQIKGRPCAASDQYALAVVVYEWLCGSCPFIGTDYIAIASQHLFASPPPIHESTTSQAVEAVVLRALAKEPTQRFECVQAFADALEESCLRETNTPAISSRPSSLPLSSLAGSRLSSTGHSPSRRALMIGLAGAAATGGGVLLLRHLQESQARPHPALLPTATHSPGHAPLGTTLFTYRGHSDAVYGVAWSADGTRIASWSVDATMQIWDAATGRTLATHSMTNVLTWSPDWTRIASLKAGIRADYNIQLWEITTGQIIAVYTTHSTGLMFWGSSTWSFLPTNNMVSWSPDGRHLASALDDTTVRVWDIVTGRQVFSSLYSALSSPANVAWSPDGRSLASGGLSTDPNNSSRAQVQVWNIATGSQISTYRDHPGDTSSIGWSPDGKRIASANDDGMVYVWNALTGKHLVTCRKQFTIGCSQLAWSPDGKHIVGIASSALTARDPTATVTPIVQIWDATTGAPIYTYRGHTNGTNAAVWSPDGTRIASASSDHTVKVWQAL